MSTPYANTAIQTAQITLTGGAAAVKVGSGGSGAALASRLVWRGIVQDGLQVYLGPSGVTDTTGYPMQAGIPEERACGPSVDIYAYAAGSGSIKIYIEETSG